MRNSTIDCTRLVAAFFVIALHVGTYSDVSYTFGELARIAGRWAVPFFFVVTGYFIGLQEKESKCHLQAFRILKIFLISSIMYLPYCFMKNPDYLESLTLTRFVISGTYFHLWFLSSLAIGLLAFQFLHKTLPKSLLVVSFILITAYVITDLAAYLETENAFTALHGKIRHTMSLAFIIIGYKMSRLNIDKTPLNGLMASSLFILFLVYFTEPLLLDFLIGSNAMARQFPAFTALVTIAIMFLCLKGKMEKSVFSEAGKNYSLGIYLVHPLFMPIFSKIFTYFPSLPQTIPVLISTFLFSWLFVSILMRRVPFLYRLLYGDFKLSRRA
ncbi:acyltransferase [Aestuariibacter sp. A3R04]|uniref:acyltransferase family protein n=1 Tax=Aestuariibacter sp. A3R04 TaxID=2841571 RepID=UPI001C09ED0B|nr:acyltransferase [Aestuariibacter sp. A3R04]MBU3023757.1 acyltransferase [Aestuariibacter sp. A3R04]